MSQTGLNQVRLKSAPHIGARVPAASIRVAVAVVGLALCVSQIPFGFWFWVSVALTAVAAIFPALPAAWLLMVVLGINALTRPETALDWRIYALIAGVHLLHILASYARVLPSLLWIQLRSLMPALRRYLFIQIPLQLVAFGALAVFARHPAVAGDSAVHITFGIVACVALLLIAVVLITPLIRDKARNSR